MSLLLLALLTLPAQKPTVETLFVKVGPYALVPGRSPKQDRAVVLIQGLNVTFFSKAKVIKPSLRSWQQYDSVLVKKLARDSDVYALCFGQTIACDQISEVEEVLDHIRGLKKAGYRQIVLIGHSAGGVVARHLVEDHPDLGVTKVIQTCAPNAGSGWAGLKTALSVQAAFLTSLTITARENILEERKDKRIPPNIEFTCVVASSRIGLGGDGVVSCKSQWSDDLQAQGIPIHLIKATHWDAIRSTGTDLVAKLVKEPQKRWNARTVREMRKKLLEH